MKVRFWGVRGSIPAPLTPEQIKSRIAAVVARIRPADLESPETREAFLAGLPPYLFGTVGGNTTCIEFRTRDEKLIILDAGSGLRELGASLTRRREKVKDHHMFFTHFHWDHLQGLPFFLPIYVPGNRMFFYSPDPDLETILRGQMRQPYFPVGMDVMNAELNFIRLTDSRRRIGAATVEWKKMRHPGGCMAYKISENGSSVIFATDSEITPDDFRRDEANTRFFTGVDLLILDAQYTLGEAIEKYDWGHTSYSLAIDFASEWGIKSLALFHHEPLYSDRKIHGILNSAEWYLARLQGKKLKVMLAVEGTELEF
jgi:phosphoribosyl 1,2-cyclic phosphodiesterase